MTDGLPTALPLSPDMSPMVHGELRPGEHLIWASHPLPSAYRSASVTIFIFGVIWNVVTLILLLAFVFSKGPDGIRYRPALILFFVPFVSVGLATILSPMWLTRKTRRMAYVVTDRRAIVLTRNCFGSTTVETFAPGRLTSMSCKRRRDGSGDLVFEQFSTHSGSGVTTVRRGFIGVADVVAVEWLVLTTLLPAEVRVII